MRQLRLITNFTQLLRPNNKISLCLYLHMHVTDYSIKFPWCHLVLMNFIQLHMLLLRWRKSSFLRTRPGLHFLFALGTPLWQNVAWMKRQFSVCQTPRSIYPSILNSFPVIQTASAKKSPFSRRPTAAHMEPLRLSRNMLHGWKDNQCLSNPYNLELGRN